LKKHAQQCITNGNDKAPSALSIMGKNSLQLEINRLLKQLTTIDPQ